MRVPSAPAAGPAGSAPARPTETVTRPEPGLARGVWEAPRWVFFAALAALILVSALYAARRAGLLRLRRAKGPS